MIMLTNERIRKIFRQSEALMNGHFLLTSGRHSDRYMQCARIFQYPWLAEELFRDLADKMSVPKVDVVIGPAIGGILPAYEMGRQLRAKSIFTERENGAMTLRRGFVLPAGARALITEDVVTTGGSVMEVMDLIKKHGAFVAGIGALVDRSNGKVDFGVPFASVVSLGIKSWPPEKCPMCRNHSPLVQPGSRKP